MSAMRPGAAGPLLYEEVRTIKRDKGHTYVQAWIRSAKSCMTWDVAVGQSWKSVRESTIPSFAGFPCGNPPMGNKWARRGK